MLRSKLPEVYSYQLKAKESLHDSPYLLCKYTYTFKTYNHHAYVVIVEKYKYHLYAIKYFLKSHRNSDFRYNYSTDDGRPRIKIYTCFSILQEIFNSDPDASFGFIGAESVSKHITIRVKRNNWQYDLNDKVYKEGSTNNRRYRIYKTIVDTFFDPAIFRYVKDIDMGMYIILNRNYEKEDIKLQDHIQNMLQEIFDMFS